MNTTPRNERVYDFKNSMYINIRKHYSCLTYFQNYIYFFRLFKIVKRFCDVAGSENNFFKDTHTWPVGLQSIDGAPFFLLALFLLKKAKSC